MDPATVDAVIFDLDGTLVDTNEAHVEAWHEAFRELGYDVVRARIVPEIGKGGDKLVPAIVGEEGERRDGDALRAAHGKHFLALARSTTFRVFPGVEALLTELRRRDVPTAVATSSRRAQLEAVLLSSGLELDRLVAHVVTGSDARESKPAPDLVEAALGRLGTAPPRTLMVGDTRHDGDACAQAGVPFVGVLCGGQPAGDLRTAGAVAVYADPADVLAHLPEALRSPARPVGP